MSDSQTPVWITGLGSISCLGRGREAMYDGVLKDAAAFDSGLGRVRGSDLADLDAELKNNRALALSTVAIDEAMKQAGWPRLTDDIGLIVATTTGLILKWDHEYSDFARAKLGVQEFRQSFANQPLGELGSAIRGHYGHTGPLSVVTSACSASLQALGLASMWLTQKRVQRCLVVGVEVLSDLTSDGFRSLQLLSPGPAKPFDQNRGGINLSEGAGALCLDSQAPHGRRLARVSGFGFTSDGYHMTGPHPEGDGCYRAMQQTLKMAGLKPTDIDWIHAHGTGSQQNDLSEGLAIARLFGGAGEGSPWVSSTKGLHGHALGAAGALESVLVVDAMGRDRVLKTRGLESPDAKIPVRHPRADVSMKIRHVLKNTLGFGGANASIVFSHPGESAP